MSGSDIFLTASCPYREGGAIHDVLELLHARRYLAAMRADRDLPRTVTIAVRVEGRIQRRSYSESQLAGLVSRLDNVVATCASCRANFKSELGVTDEVGCHVRLDFPLDPIAERMLYDTLREAARPERFDGEQGNFLHALIATGRVKGARMMQLVNSLADRGIGRGVSEEGQRSVGFVIEDRTFPVSVYALLEWLFLRDHLPARAVGDVAEFLRAFYAVVGRNVSGPQGQLDPHRNRSFWAQSEALRAVNLFGQLVHHARKLGVGVRLES